jgi:predicted extracellular nuclease
MKTTLTLAIAAGLALAANADIRITEWMYSGDDGEFIEFTNVGAVAIDMTGWSYDDDSRVAGTVSLSAFGVVQPGESVILCEPDAATFRASWSLSAAVDIIGSNTTNIGRADELNLFDASNALVDRLTYGDNTIGGPRTQNASASALPGDLGTNNVLAWLLSTPGDQFNSYFGALGNVANPGSYIPGPGALALVGVGAMVGTRRRR